MLTAALIPVVLLLSLTSGVPSRSSPASRSAPAAAESEVPLEYARVAYEESLRAIRGDLLVELEKQRKRHADPAVRAAADGDLQAFTQHGAWPRSIDTSYQKRGLLTAKLALRAALSAEADRWRTKGSLEMQKSLLAESEKVLRINDLGGWYEVLDLARQEEPSGWTRQTQSWKRVPVDGEGPDPAPIGLSGPTPGDYEIDIVYTGTRPGERLVIELPDVDGVPLFFTQRVATGATAEVREGRALDSSMQGTGRPRNLRVLVAAKEVVARLDGQPVRRDEFQRCDAPWAGAASDKSTKIRIGSDRDSSLELQAVRVRRQHRFDVDFFAPELVKGAAASQAPDSTSLQVGQKFRGSFVGNGEYRFECDAVVKALSKSAATVELTVHWTSGKGVLILELNRAGKSLSMSKDVQLASTHKYLRVIEAAKLSGTGTGTAMKLAGSWYEKGHNGVKTDFRIKIELKAQ